MIGSTQTIIICRTQQGATNNNPCPDGSIPSTQTAYVLDSSSQSFIEGLSNPLDYQECAQLFGLIFISTVSFFFIVKSITSVVKFINTNTRN